MRLPTVSPCPLALLDAQAHTADRLRRINVDEQRPVFQHLRRFVRNGLERYAEAMQSLRRGRSNFVPFFLDLRSQHHVVHSVAGSDPDRCLDGAANGVHVWEPRPEQMSHVGHRTLMRPDVFHDSILTVLANDGDDCATLVVALYAFFASSINYWNGPVAAAAPPTLGAMVSETLARHRVHVLRNDLGTKRCSALDNRFD